LCCGLRRRTQQQQKRKQASDRGHGGQDIIVGCNCLAAVWVVSS
jgi:hypothetical protein